MGLTTALIAGGVGVLGAGASIYGANKAASAQKNATTSANALTQSMFDKTQANLKPYIDNGVSSGNKLFSMLNDTGPNGLFTPFNPTMDQLEQTPGYQFTKQQGINAVNNSNSVKGWGDSGPGAKGIADYVTGLASNTYQQQFGNYWTNKQNAYGMLFPSYQTGANAAMGQGQIGANAAASQGNNLIGAGNAAGAAAIGTGNAIGQAPMNALLEYSALDSAMNGGGTSSSPSAYASWGIPSFLSARYGAIAPRSL